MFLWFDIENNKQKWNDLLNKGYEYLFNNFAYLQLHKPGKSLLCGIISNNNELKIGGIFHNNKQVFEIFMFPECASPDVSGRLFQWLKDNDVSKVIIHSFARGIEEFKHLSFKYSITERLEFITSEQYCSELNKGSLHKTHRRTINKLEKQELRLTIINKNFFMHLIVSFIYKVKRKPYLLAGVKSVVKEIFQLVKLSKCLRLENEFVLYSIVDNKNKNLSYALLLESGDCAYYMMGASTESGYKIRSSVYLMWLLLNKYCNDAVEFNMGGVNISSQTDKGVYQFKQQFSLSEHSRTSIQVKL